MKFSRKSLLIIIPLVFLGLFGVFYIKQRRQIHSLSAQEKVRLESVLEELPNEKKKFVLYLLEIFDRSQRIFIYEQFGELTCADILYLKEKLENLSQIQCNFLYIYIKRWAAKEATFWFEKVEKLSDFERKKFLADCLRDLTI